MLEVTIPIAAISDSQNHPVSCAEITAPVSSARILSRFISKAVTAPQTTLRIAATRDSSFHALIKLKAMTANIRIGTSHSSALSLRASSKPLNESCAPAQLTCSQGKKKQTSTITAALTLIRRNIFILPILIADCRLKSS
jgi:hypothetical protein